MDFKSFFGHKAKNPQEMDINELNAAFLAFLDDCKPSPETHAKLLALPHEKKRAMLESYQKTRGNEKYHGLASTSSSGSSQKDKHTKREGITSALGMGMVGRRISHKSNRMSTSSSNGSLTSTTPEFMVSEPILNPPVTLNYSPEAIRDLNKKLTGMMVDLGLPPKVQADILNSTPENKQKMIDEFQRQLKGGVLKATPPPRGRSPGPGSMGSHNTSPLMPPLSPPKRDASLDPESKIRPRSSSYFDPTPIPLTRTPTASSLESIDSISPPSSPVILRPESITNLTGHELQKQFEYVLNELHLKEGPRNNIMRTSDETKKREIVRLFWDRQAQLQAQPVVQMRASHPPAPPASYPVPNPAVGFSQTKRLGTVFRPSMIPPSPLAPPPTVKFPEPSSFFVSSTSPHYPNVPRFQPGTAPPPPFTLMPVPENFAVTNSGQLPHFPPRKNFHPPADFMETRQQQRPLSIVSTPPVVLPNSSKTPPTDVPPSPFVDAPANKSTLELLAVSAPEPEAPPKIESMGTFEMTPALFINQMTNRNTPLKTLFRQLTGLRIQLSFAAPEWIEIFLATTTDAPTQLAKPIRGIQCMQVPLERCRQAKMDRDRVHIQRERDALIKSGVISAVDGTGGAELVDTGGAPVAGRYADDVLEDELLSEVMQCITNVTNLDSGRSDVVASPEMIDQICFALAIDRSSVVAGGGLLSLMTENEPGTHSAPAVKESDDQENGVEDEGEVEAFEDDLEIVRKRQQANLELRALVLELLGPICLVSQEGHSLVLAGLAKLARLQAEPAPMQYLVSSLLDPYAPHSMGSYDDFAAQYSAAKLRAQKRKERHERRRRYLRRKRRLERQARRESAAARGLPTSDDDDYDDDDEEVDIDEEEEVLSDVDSAYGGTEDDDEDYDEALDEEAAEREDREWEYRESVLVFINGLISVNDNIEERLRIRRSFEQLGFRKVAAILRTMEPSEAVETQLNVFEEDRSGDIEELERMHREKNALLGDPMDTLKQTVERIKILPRSERTLNLLYSTLAYISTIVAATLENKRPSTDQGDGPSSPIVAAEVDAANETIGDAIAESLSLVKASTATIAGAVVAWEESFSDVEDQKRKAKAKEKNRKERFQSLATDVVKALGNVSSVDFEMSELNDKNLNSATGGGNLIALRQQVLDLRQMNEKAVADVQKYHKEVESLKAALQRAQRGIANPEAVAQTYEQRGTVDISKPLAETDGDDPVPPPISTQLYDEVQRLQALVKTLRKVKETEADTATRAERIQNEDLQRIEGLLRKIQSGGLPEEDSGDSSTASGAPVPPPPPSDNSSGAPPPPPGPPPPPSGGSIPVPRAPLPKLNMPKAVKPMKPLQWNKVKENLVPNSIWKELAVETYNESDGDPSSLGLNVKMISEMFGKDETKIKAATVSPVPAKKIKKSLLEPKRAKAIAIMLAVLKQQIGLDTLRDEILGAELTLINEEQLRMLQMNAPTKFEVEQVLNFEGEISELGEAEQFIYAVADLKRLPQRLTSMMFKMRFIPEIEEITTDLDNVLNACKEVRDSRRLRRVLQKVLVVGNYLNGSSFRGNAFGFQMDALLKLKEVKTNGQDKLNPTLLHFIVRQIQFDDPDALIFWRDMPHVETASSVMFGKVSGSVEALRQGWRQIIKEKEALEPFEHLRNPKDRFLEVVKEFVQTSESRLKATEEKLVLAEKSINDLLMFYGETTDDKTPQQFFSIITSFSKAFDKAKEDNRLADSRWYHEVVKAKTRRAAKGLSLIGDSRASAPNIAVTPSGPDGGGLTVPVDPTTMGVSALRFFDPKAMLKPVPGSEAFSRRLTVRGFAGPGRVVDGQLGVAMQMMRNGTLRLRRSMLFTDTPSIFEGQHVGSSDSGTGIGSAGQADPGGVKDTDAPAATGEAVSAVLDSYTYSASETETDA